MYLCEDTEKKNADYVMPDAEAFEMIYFNDLYLKKRD
jgi:hypothetical protein